MKEYIKTLTYGLKNLEGIKETYKDYKTKEFNQLIKNSKEGIKIHFKCLQVDIENNFYTGKRRFFFENLDLSTKIDTRFLKTNINHVRQEINEEFMGSIIPRPNKNKIRCFAIRFYLKHYAKINKIMYNTLEDMVEREQE